MTTTLTATPFPAAPLHPPGQSTTGTASPVIPTPPAARDRAPRLPRPDRRSRRDRARRVLVGDVALDLVEAHPSNIRRNLGDLLAGTHTPTPTITAPETATAPAAGTSPARDDQKSGRTR